MKATLTGELLLLVGVLALAYFIWLQQAQLVELELELDRVRGAVGSNLPPVPVAAENGAEATAAKPTRKRAPRGA